MDNKRLIVALDVPEAAPALALAARLDPKLCRVKVGKELFTAAGPAVVEQLQQRGFEVFLDLKYHDIPNTVAGACRAAARLGVGLLHVPASGGEAGAWPLPSAPWQTAHCTPDTLRPVSITCGSTRRAWLVGGASASRCGKALR